jgi:hypothetical protein
MHVLFSIIYIYQVRSTEAPGSSQFDEILCFVNCMLLEFLSLRGGHEIVPTRLKPIYQCTHSQGLLGNPNQFMQVMWHAVSLTQRAISCNVRPLALLWERGMLYNNNMIQFHNCSVDGIYRIDCSHC